MKNLIEGLKKRFSTEKPVQKADPGMDDGADSPDASNLDVVDEVMDKLESGELSPETDAIVEYLTGSGMPEDEAQSAAQVILDSYLAEGEQEEKSELTPEDGEEGGDMEHEEPDGDEGLKSLFTKFGKKQNQQNEAFEVILKALNATLDTLDSQSKRLETLEKEIRKAGVNPSQETKKPVRKAIVPGGVSKTEAANLILKGVLAGELTANDMNLYETNGGISTAAQEYINKNKGVLK